MSRLLKTNCAFCGKYRNATKDHIPPQCIFASPRPSNLITVPACKPCHRGTTLDDEYFKTALALNEKTREHPDIKSILPSVIRGLNKPSKKGFSHAFIRTTFMASVKTEAGIYIGNRLAFRPDGVRLIRVVERIIRGLYYHLKNKPLPHSIDILADILDPSDKYSLYHNEEFQSTFFAPLLNEGKNVIGNNTFIYWYKILEEKHHVSAWFILFYNSIGFLAIAAPKSLVDDRGIDV